MISIASKIVRTPYAVVGCVFLIGAVGALQSDLRAILLGRFAGFNWQVFTGLSLLIVMIYQWVLMYLRVRKARVDMRKHVQIHRWMGVVGIGFFMLHAVRFGHTWTTVLAVVFLGAALTGLLNRELIGYKQRWMYLIWLGVHISTSTLLIPLVALHIWIALFYQGAG